MPGPLHSAQTTADGIHTPISYVYADATARGAATGFVATDVGKFAYQTDTNSLWYLINHSPATWNEFATTGPEGTVITTFSWGNDNVGTSATVRYMTPGWGDLTARVYPLQFISPVVGILRRLKVLHNVAGSGAGTVTYTVRVNGVPSALTATLNATDGSGGDVVHTASIVVGDFVDLMVTKAGVVDVSPRDVIAVVEVS